MTRTSNDHRRNLHHCAAQSTAPHPISSGPELSLEYTYLRSNGPVDKCGCFSPQGGSASFAVPLPGGHFSLAGDVTVGHAGKIAAHDYDLTLTTFTAGVRYRPALSLGRIVPFGRCWLEALMREAAWWKETLPQRTLR